MSIKKKVAATFAAGVGMALAFGGMAMAAPTLGNIDPTEEASLTIHKYSGDPVEDAANDGSVVTGIPNTPLDGVEFTLYEVTGLDIHNPADWPKITDLNTAVADETATLNEGPPLTLGGYAVTKVSAKTTTGGTVTWGCPAFQGVYYVMETGAPASVAEHTLPFLVTVPMAHNSDNTWIYDVNVYPKNALVDIKKEVTDPGAAGLGSDVTWTVTNKVPSVQRPFEIYKLHDELDSRLTYVSNTLVFGTGFAGDQLVAGTDYTFTNSPEGTLNVVFLAPGLTKLTANQGKDLIWTIETTVTSLGTTGGDITSGIIPNKAGVIINNPGTDWVESPEVTSNRC